MSQASRRFRAPAWLLVLALAAATTLVANASAQAATKPPVPAAKTLPAAIEPLPSYQQPTACDPVAKAGPKKLEALLKQTYGSTAFGITRACTGGVPTSEHMEGRAIDWMQGGGTTPADANAFLAWLLATDAHGNQAAMARRMGIMYVIWQNRMFRVYQPQLGWQPYENCATAAMKSAAEDTYCHRNHVHISFTWDGAMARTSYWSGTAVTVPDCDSPRGEPKAVSTTAKGLEYVPMAETPLLDTTTGLGTPSGQPCRLAQSGYDGEDRRLDVQVAGVAGIPSTARAVVLQVRAGSPNAKGTLSVQPTGSSSWAAGVVTPVAGVSDGNTVTVPVGADGSVSLTLLTGQAYVAVDVLGYFVPRGDPAGTDLHAMHPHVALTTSATSAATLGVSRAELGVPASATAVSLSVTVSGGSVGGGVRVFGVGDPAPPVRAAAPTAGAGRNASAATIVRLAPGAGISLKNGTGTRNVQVVVTGWYAPASIAGGAVYSTLKPTVVVDTTSKIGLTAPLTAGVTRTATLAGVHGVPSTAVAVVGEARLTSTARTQALGWSTGAVPAARLLSDESGRATTTELLAQVASTKGTHFSTDAGTTDLRLVAVGAWLPGA